VPNADLGEEVKAVVQPMPGISPGPDLAQELISFCSQSLSRQKVPRSIDFEAELPRLPTGKLYKRLLRDRYWATRRPGFCDGAAMSLVPPVRLCRKPDDMMRPAALGGGAYGNLVHSEAGVAKPFGKWRIRPGRPHRKDAARPQCPADRL